MDMSRWQIEWDSVGQKWVIIYFGPGVTVSANYDADHLKQNPITLCFADGTSINVKWAWTPQHGSPSPIKVMRKLCKLAELHRPKGER